MQGFGTQADLYERAHDWAAREDREARLPTRRTGDDMRLPVFHSPLTGWTDAVVMNVVMGLATEVALTELARAAYQPLAEVMRDILPRERRHRELGLEGLTRIDATEEVRASVADWMPRVAETFGSDGSDRIERLRAMGLRHETNETLRARWRERALADLAEAGLTDLEGPMHAG